MTARQTEKRGSRERRPRVFLGEDVIFKPRHQDNCRGIVRNVSETGALLESLKKLGKGTELILYVPLDLKTKKSLCMVSGRIVRVANGNRIPSLRGYGIEFDADISPSSKKMLQDFVTLKETGSLPDDGRRQRVSPYKD